jgi:NADH dehydrogenase (ubiquinone) 1 alpha subcomplex subunit 6
MRTAGGQIYIAINWADARRRVLKSYREWLRAAPEIQSMYSLNMPVAQIRAKCRQEFERHRYINHLQAVDVLLQQSHAEFQVSLFFFGSPLFFFE